MTLQGLVLESDLVYGVASASMESDLGDVEWSRLRSDLRTCLENHLGVVSSAISVTSWRAISVTRRVAISV